MEEIEKLKERLNKASEIFKNMKKEIENKDDLIKQLQEENSELKKKCEEYQKDSWDQITKNSKINSEIKNMNNKLVSDFNLFE